MRRIMILSLIALFLFSAAYAESDLSSMSSDELTQLRQSIDIELARRIQTDDSLQTIKVGDLIFKLHQPIYLVNKSDKHLFIAVLSVSNTSDRTYNFFSDVEYNITQNGKLLKSTEIYSDEYTGPDLYDSFKADIKPGAIDMQLSIDGQLDADGGDKVEIDFYNKKAPRGEEPYCGTFVIDLSELK